MAIINLTPHKLNIMSAEVDMIVVPPSPEGPARVSSETRAGGTIDIEGTEVPLYRTEFGAVEGLPDPREGVFYVVSRMVASAACERQDLLVPGPLVRDDQGRVIGCMGLSKP